MISLILLWLRGAGLVGQTMALGSVAFALIVLRGDAERGVDRFLTVVRFGALVAVVAQIGILATVASALSADGARWTIVDAVGSTVIVAGLARIAAGILVLAAARAVRRMPASRLRGFSLLGSTLLLCVSGALTSHAMGRLDDRAWLVIVTALHQVFVGAWVGGLVCAVIWWMGAAPSADAAWLRRFSVVALVTVAGIAVTGTVLTFVYVATPGAAVGTSYGAMVLTKVVIFIALLAMAALNHRAVHGGLAFGRWSARRDFVIDAGAMLLRRRVEVEAGLALVAVLLAASIGTAPPAVDVVAQGATPAEIRAFFTPQWPRLTSPSLAEIAAIPTLADPDAPHPAELTAWSEFGHNVAGLFVFAMGVLATLERTGRAPWARHWPLLIVALTGFVGWSLDPEGWQTGAVGFWEQLLSAEVIQHRILLLLSAVVGFAEWRVRSGRHPDSPWRYVLPLVLIWSGLLLIAHTHDVNNSKSVFFMELSHLLLGLVALLAGWSRWLELRLPSGASGWPGRIWGPALAVFGLLLVLYREV